MVTAVQGASNAQRLDRLPLTWTHLRLALVTQAGWGLVVAIDAIAARIYPFVWGSEHAFGTAQFSVLLVAYVIVPVALLVARFGIDQRAAQVERVTGA